MKDPFETTTPTDRLSLRRILAYSGALAVHVGLFAFLMYPVSHEAQASDARDTRVVIDFHEPPPPPPPPPPPIPDPPPIVKLVKRQAPPPPAPVTTPPEPNRIVEVVPPGPPGPPDDGPVIPVEPQATGPITAKSGELSIVRGRLAYNAKIRNLAGRVELRILVGTDGRPVEIVIEKSSGEPRLDQEAKRQAKDWVFTPAIRNGEKVLAWAVVPIVFQLDQG